MKKTKLPILFLILTLVLITIIISFSLYKQKINNKLIINEVDRINSLPYEKEQYDILTSEDFKTLLELTKNNNHARSFVDEVVWLADNKEPKHVGHSIYYLKSYIETGEDNLCIPHELTHIKLYIKHEDFDLVESQIKIIEKYNNQWLKVSEKQKQAFPQYYKNFDDFLLKMNEAVERIKNHDYSSKTIELLDYIEQNEVC